MALASLSSLSDVEASEILDDKAWWGLAFSYSELACRLTRQIPELRDPTLRATLLGLSSLPQVRANNKGLADVMRRWLRRDDYEKGAGGGAYWPKPLMDPYVPTALAILEHGAELGSALSEALVAKQEGRPPPLALIVMQQKKDRTKAVRLLRLLVEASPSLATDVLAALLAAYPCMVTRGLPAEPLAVGTEVRCRFRGRDRYLARHYRGRVERVSDGGKSYDVRFTSTHSSYTQPPESTIINTTLASLARPIDTPPIPNPLNLRSSILTRRSLRSPNRSSTTTGTGRLRRRRSSSTRRRLRAPPAPGTDRLWGAVSRLARKWRPASEARPSTFRVPS